MKRNQAPCRYFLLIRHSRSKGCKVKLGVQNLECFFYSHLSTQTSLEVLQEKCNTTTATNSHVVLQLEHAQSLLLQFSEGLTEVSPWLEETQFLVGQLSLSTISYEAFREQQDLLQVKKQKKREEKCFSFYTHLCFCYHSLLFNKLLYNRLLLNVYAALLQFVGKVKKCNSV